MVLLAIWVPCLFVVLASLMTDHWATLPRPSTTDTTLQEALGRLRTPTDPGRWTAYHVLYDGCRCSRRVLDHLVGSPRNGDVDDLVLFVGDDDRVRGEFAARRMRFVSLTQAELEADYGILAAPLLLVTDPSGQLRYSGGYTDRKQGLACHDLEIVRDLRAGSEVAPLPVYGCGVSTSLQQVLDPLGLKY